MLPDLLLSLFSNAVVDTIEGSQDRGKSGTLDKAATIGTGAALSRQQVLERDHERLKLVTMAMWELLRERTGISEAELKAKIDEVDMMDGKKDGRIRIRPTVNDCATCGRKVRSNAVACPYCGARQDTREFF